MTHLNKFVEPHTDEFPGANFRAFDDIPAAECSEAKIEGDTAHTWTADTHLYDPGKFAGYNLTGKVCTIISSVGGNIGDFDITWNDDGVIGFAQDPGNGTQVHFNVHDGGALILTHTVSSLAALARSLNKAYTFASGCFYSDMTEPHIQAACSILYDPQIDQPLWPP